MSRPELTFDKVVSEYARKLMDPTVSISELIGQVQLVKHASSVSDCKKILWLIDVAKDCWPDQQPISTAATTTIVQLSRASLMFDHFLMDNTERTEVALRTTWFFADKPCVAKINDEYKKKAEEFLRGWWNGFVYDTHLQDKNRDNPTAHYRRYQEWLRALTGAFVQLEHHDHLYYSGAISAIPRLYKVAKKRYAESLNCGQLLPDMLCWRQWHNLPIIGAQWNAIISREDGKDELHAITSRNPEDLRADESTISTLCRQALAHGRTGDTLPILLALSATFQQLREDLLK